MRTLLVGMLALASLAAASESDLEARLLQGGHVLMMRHAQAPGFSDPLEFRLGDCATQRNLDQTGCEQASAVGDWLRARGINCARIYSSQWCRCLETAQLLGRG